MLKRIAKRTGVQSLHTLTETQVGFIETEKNNIRDWAKRYLQDGDFLVESLRSNYDYTIFNVADCGAKWEDVLANNRADALIAYVKNEEFNAIYY